MKLTDVIRRPLITEKTSIQRERDGRTIVFEVATHMVEYVDSLCAVRERHLKVRSQWVERIRHVLLKSAAARGVRLSLPAATAAQGMQALTDGLIQNWLLDPGAFELEAVGMKALDVYLRGLGLE